MFIGNINILGIIYLNDKFEIDEIFLFENKSLENYYIVLDYVNENFVFRCLSGLWMNILYVNFYVFKKRYNFNV